MVFYTSTERNSLSIINRLLLFVIFVVICIYLSSLLTLRSINRAFDKYGFIGKCFIICIVVLMVINIIVIFKCIVNTDNIEGLSCTPFISEGVTIKNDMAQSFDNPFMAKFGYSCKAGMMGPIPSARNSSDQTLITNAAIVNSTGKAQSEYDTIPAEPVVK